ncbi:inner membrane-spanning protein YciB [Gallaecimonas sp. GXIMD4217]|uniref:inner membrane-spanning protein YciB n=1 Tax=Gallaecimonas sp. GXIMD4217 TaxID=3131927 RepID=UPI00311B104B
MALLEYLPLIAFFIAYKLADIYVATAVLMGCSALTLVVTRIMGKPISKQQWWLFGAIMAFGAMTLAFRSDLFLKWKFTLVYSAFAIAMAASELMGKNLIKKAMGEMIPAPEALWRRLAFAWSGFFATLAGVNLLVAYNFSQQTWVNFKVFWTMGLTFGAVVLTVLSLYKYLPADEEQDKQ